MKRTSKYRIEVDGRKKMNDRNGSAEFACKSSRRAMMKVVLGPIGSPQFLAGGHQFSECIGGLLVAESGMARFLCYAKTTSKSIWTLNKLRKLVIRWISLISHISLLRVQARLQVHIT
jgi:hypothetical protein